MKFRPISGKITMEYPCRWVYKIFGRDKDRMREALGEVLAGYDYSVTPSRSSRHGNYHCMNLDIPVSNEQERTGIYEALQAHSAIILVL